jgi:hypothetical protein
VFVLHAAILLSISGEHTIELLDLVRLRQREGEQYAPLLRFRVSAATRPIALSLVSSIACPEPPAWTGRSTRQLPLLSGMPPLGRPKAGR